MAISGFVALTAINLQEQRKREKRVIRRQDEARNVERAQRASEATRSRRQQVREARVRRAEVLNLAGTGGQTGSSAAVAASDTLQRQLATNIGAIGTSLATGEAKSIAEQNIFTAGRASFLEKTSAIGQSMFGAAVSSGGSGGG